MSDPLWTSVEDRQHRLRAAAVAHRRAREARAARRRNQLRQRTLWARPVNTGGGAAA